jgi:hypothetical protein
MSAPADDVGSAPAERVADIDALIVRARLARMSARRNRHSALAARLRVAESATYRQLGRPCSP